MIFLPGVYVTTNVFAIFSSVSGIYLLTVFNNVIVFASLILWSILA